MRTPRNGAMALGALLFCASMALLLPAQARGQTAPQVTLTSVLISKNTVTVNYSKNFTTCAQLKLVSNNQLVHTNNLFCTNNGPITVTRTQFTATLQPGVKVKLCHGSNGTICSGEVTTQALADLMITKSAPPSVVLGNTIMYTMTVLNLGEAAQNVVMTDTFPSGLQYISTAVLPSATVNNSSSNVTCTGTGALTCRVANFAAGGSLTFNVSMKVVSPSNQPSTVPYCPTTISNSAKVSTSTTETNMPNNTSAIIRTVINCPLMSFTVSLTSIPVASGTPSLVRVKPGDTVTFTRSVREFGVINSSFQWNWNASVLNCAAYPAFDSPSLRCTALAAGQTNVSITMLLVMADGSQRSVTSNGIGVLVAAPPLCALTSLPAAVQDFVNAGYVSLAEACAKIGKNAIRKDFIKLIVELNGGILSSSPSTPSFDDVPLSHSHFRWYEESGKEGWIRGDNNCYGTHPCFERPENTLIRGYFALVAQRSFGLTVTGAAPQFLDNPAGNDTATALQAAGDHCALLPNATGQYISPNGVMLFEDMLAALKRIDQGNLQWGRDCGPITTGSSLTVTFSPKNPLGDTVPKGAQSVALLTLNLTASTSDVTVQSIKIRHEGIGSSADFSRVYAVVLGARVTNNSTFNPQTSLAALTFTKPLVVKAGTTVRVQLTGDFKTAATAGGEHGFTLELPSDITSSTTVQGNFPLRGKIFRVGAVNSGVVSISYLPVTSSNVSVNDARVEIGKWQISVDSIEDQTLYAMTIYNKRTAIDGDFINIAIQRSDGTILTTTVAATVGNFATLVFDPPFTVLEGDKVILSAIADIKSGVGKNIKLLFIQPSDIFSVGSLYGYGVNGQLYGSTVALPVETSALPSTVTIVSGQTTTQSLTTTINGPVTKQYTSSSENAVLANIALETRSGDITMENLFVLVQGTTTAGSSFIQGRPGIPSSADQIHEILENVHLRDATSGQVTQGVRLTGSNDFGASSPSTGGAYQIYRFDNVTIHGAEMDEFRVDFIDNSGLGALAAPADGDKFRVHICGEATIKNNASGVPVANTVGCSFGGFFPTTSTAYQMKIKDVATNAPVSDYRPGGTISGNYHVIAAPGLVITSKALASNDTVVANKKNVPLLRFEGRAQNGDIRLTQAAFSAAQGSLISGTNYTLWVDTNNDAIVDTILQKNVSPQSGTIAFNALAGGGFVVPNGTSVIFEIHTDIAASLASNILQLKFATLSSNYVAAELVNDGSDLSGIKTDGVCPSSCQITVTTVPSTVFTLRSQGDLYITKSSTPVRSRQLLGGTLSDEILRLQLHAEYEDIDVNFLVFTADGTDAASFSTNVDYLKLYKVGETTSFGTGSVVACGGITVPANSMCAKMNNQELIVQKGSNLNVLVRPRMRTDLNGNGAVSGQHVKLKVDAAAGAKARGLFSSNNLSQNNGDSVPAGEVFIGVSTASPSQTITGNDNVVVLSKVLSITNADPNANGTAIPTGTGAIAQFKFSAAAASNMNNGPNKVTIADIAFNLNATNVLLGTGDQTSTTTSDFKIYNKAAPSVKSTCTANQTSATGPSLLITCTGIDAVLQTAIDPGSDLTLVLEAEIVNPKISNTQTSTLQTSLRNFSDIFSPSFGAATSHFRWLDRDAGSSTPFLWIEYPETQVNGTSYQS